MGRPLVIWGASGHAKVLLDVLRAPAYEAVAFFDNAADAVAPVAGIALYRGSEGFERWRGEHPELEAAAVVAIGGARGADRVAIARMLGAGGLDLIDVLHETADIAASARLGTGAQVLAQASVGADAALGDGCIVNTSATVDHESVLGDGVHVAPGATVTGLVLIGDGALVGAGAVVLPRIRIGAGAVVGAGSVVTRDVADGAVVAGNPARPM